MSLSKCIIARKHKVITIITIPKNQSLLQSLTIKIPLVKNLEKD